MNRLFFIFIAALMIAALHTAGAQQNTAHIEKQLARAHHKATVDGDLQGAIEEYKRIVAAAGTSRTVAAKALVSMAECYQKLGDAQARNIYEQLLRDYHDQKEAVAAARAYLGNGSAVTRSTGDRAVWSGPGVDLFGTVSPDGRLLTYVDWARTGNLMVRDLVAGTDRALTSNTSYGEFGGAGWSAISRDGEHVAYGWNPKGADTPLEVRVLPLRGAGTPSSKLIVQGLGRDVRPFDWSPDGKMLATLIEREDGSSQIGTVAVSDGTIRPLKSINWRGVNKMVFSPDGQFIAYDLAGGDVPDRTQIFVMAIDGSRETAVVEDSSKNHLMGWSPQGQLLFASDRSGTTSLWSVGIERGKAVSAPILVKSNIGSFWSLGLTPSGSLYIWRRADGTYVRVAAVDMAAGVMLNSATGTFQRFIDSRGRPDWSGDGKHLLYMSCGPAGGGPCILSVRSTETGAVHNVPHKLQYMARPRLSPDGTAIITDGSDLKGRPGIYHIDAKTGDTSLIKAGEVGTPQNYPDWSEDGRHIRYQYQPATRDYGAVIEMEVGSQAEREIFRVTERGLGRLIPSPDGRFIGYIKTDPATKNTELHVATTDTRTSKVLVTATHPQQLNFWWQWTPDSQSVIVRKDTQHQQPQLWIAPVSGLARQLQIDSSKWSEGPFFELHPDGRHVAVIETAGKPGAEVWVLENFLPRSRANGQTARTAK